MSKEDELGKKERGLKDARILMVSRFKSGAIGGVPSTIHSLETYWSGIVQNISTLRKDNEDLIDINSNWDLIIFHHPSTFWINRFMDLPDSLKRKSSIIWHQAVDQEALETLRTLGVVNLSSSTTTEETTKRKLIANYPGVSNYAVSDVVRDSLVKEDILSLEKISVVQIPPSLPTEAINLKKFNERGNGKFVILVVSRISPEKGIENILNIYKDMFNIIQASPAGYSKTINFLVAGDATNKSYGNAIMANVKLLPTSSICSIEFLGKKSMEDLVELYSNAHIFLMPSVFDSWGLVTIEALHYGIPIVAFEAPGTKEIFSRSENNIGNLVNGVSEGVKSIIEIMTDKELWGRFSSGALTESKRYQPQELSLNLLQKLWQDKYK